MATRRRRPKDHRGGARPNSGPKPKYPGKKNRTLALTDDAVAIVDAHAGAIGPACSRSDALEDIVHAWKIRGEASRSSD